MKPVLLVTSGVPPDRVAPFRALHERRPIVVARFAGGTTRHATGGSGTQDLGFPVVDLPQRAVLREAASRRYGVVVAGTVGRVALPAAVLGARAAGVPFVLWSALWSQPHLASAPLLLHLYRRSDAVVAYGPHVAAYARRLGAREVHVAPQAVDPGFWSAPGPARDPERFDALFVGRLEPEKGVEVLLEAWRAAALDRATATLTVVGGGDDGPLRGSVRDVLGITFAGPRTPEEVRNFLARASVLVVPSIATRRFREPWGLVANEAMHQHLPVIATDAVGAVAGGLVRHERNGLVVAQRDAPALARALERLHADRELRLRLGEHAGRDVAAFTPEAWAAGMATAVDAVEAA